MVHIRALHVRGGTVGDRQQLGDAGLVRSILAKRSRSASVTTRGHALARGLRDGLC
jgi:hypothetical protein